jgi:hypothetical protein
MKKAEITAFLSLVFILTVSFVLGILEVSVIHTTKNLNRLAADRAVFSVFGEYHGKLLEDYHVFAIEGSYGTGEYSDERLIGRMRYYGTAGMEQEITGIQYLTDLNGQAFREQVLQYMEERYGLSLIRDFTGLTSRWEEQAIQGEEMEETEGNILDEVNDLMENAQFPEEDGAADTQENQDTDFADPGTDVISPDSTGMENLTEGGPFTCIDQIEKSGILSVVMPKDMELSGLAIELETQPSARSLNTGRGTFPVRQGTDGVEEKLLFNEYVLKNFSCAVPDEGQSVSTGENEGTESRSLAYETEYILEGKSSDKENLESFLMKLFLVRMALNYVYLMGDSAKQAEVTALAVAVTTALLIPEAAEVLKQLILLAWAAGESVVDIRTLLSGNRTALIKSSDTWQLPLSSLLTLGSGTEQIDGSDVPGGITYKDYLRMFLFLKDPDDINMRVLDRIEENITMEYGMDWFRTDQCITKIEVKNTSEILGGITYTFPVYFGYE